MAVFHMFLLCFLVFLIKGLKPNPIDQSFVINNKINEFLTNNDLLNLSNVNKNNNKNVKNMTFNYKELNINYFINKNNSKFIKALLLTKQGVYFIKNLNNTENIKLWMFAIQLNDIQLLRGLNSTGITIHMPRNKLVRIIKTFRLVDYYETFEFLLNYITLNDKIATSLLRLVLYPLTTPNNKKQQHMQFNIIKKLVEFPSAIVELKMNLLQVIETLNIPLVDYFINKYNIKINELFNGDTILQWIVYYMIIFYNKNVKFAYELFDHLLSKEAIDVYTKNTDGNDVYFYIRIIPNKTIANNFIEIIKNHQTSNKL